MSLTIPGRSFPVAGSSSGVVDYNHSDNTSFVLPANTWTDLPNDGAGAFTNTASLPLGVSSLLSGSKLDFRQLAIGDTVIARFDFTVTPSVNGAVLELRLKLGAGAGTYYLPRLIGNVQNGAGVEYRQTQELLVYIGDANTRDNLVTPQVRLSVAGTCVNAGFAALITRRG